MTREDPSYLPPLSAHLCDCGKRATIGDECGPCFRARVPVEERLRLAAGMATAHAPAEPVPVVVRSAPVRPSRVVGNATYRRAGVCRRCDRVRLLHARELCRPCHSSCSRNGTIDQYGAAPKAGYEGHAVGGAPC